jgi:hypothetical protein
MFGEKRRKKSVDTIPLNLRNIYSIQYMASLSNRGENARKITTEKKRTSGSP